MLDAMSQHDDFDPYVQAEPAQPQLDPCARYRPGSRRPVAPLKKPRGRGESKPLQVRVGWDGRLIYYR